MRNRIKCMLCQDVIESTHRHDFKSCKCGACSVDGGNEYKRCLFDKPENIRILEDDDSEHEIVIPKDRLQRLEEKQEPEQIIEDMPKKKPTRKELRGILDEMIKSVESLPPHAMTDPLNQYDYSSFLMILQSILSLDADDI